MTIRFSHAINQALEFTALWLGIELPSDAKAVVNSEFGPEEVHQADLVTLNTARAARDISREAYLEELKRRSLLDDSYDIEADAIVLEEEALNLFGVPQPPADPDDEGGGGDGDKGDED